MKKITIYILGLLVIISFANAMLSDDLIAYYTFDDNYMDSLGIHNLSVTGSVPIVNGHISNATSWNANLANYLYTNTFPSGYNESTYSCWINTTNVMTTELIATNNQASAYGTIYMQISNGNVSFGVGNTTTIVDVSYPITTNKWYHVVGTTKKNNETKLYVNGTLVSVKPQTKVGPTNNELYIGRYWVSQSPLSGLLDECGFWNRTLSDVEISQLYNSGYGVPYFFVSFNFSNINCTSANPPYGDTIPPYETDDTTPTFKFETTIDMTCRISDANISYAVMGSSRDCDYGQSTRYHTCTLTSQDALVDYNTSVYVLCILGTINSSIQFPMLITSLETPNSNEAIQQGIENSVVWPGATVYTNQRVYLRSLNNSQKLATIDKVVVYGNQRWLLNYENTTSLGLFNLTPVVYSLDMKNLSIKAIRGNVTAFIDSTKN